MKLLCSLVIGMVKSQYTIFHLHLRDKQFLALMASLGASTLKIGGWGNEPGWMGSLQNFM